MLLLVADENFNNDILRGLLRRNPSLDIVRIQDVGLVKAPDPVVLEWAANENRVLLTHDRNTIPRYAYERVVEGKRMPGVIEIDYAVPMSIAIDDILLLAVLSKSGELEG
jgi:hypothetical protein